MSYKNFYFWLFFKKKKIRTSNKGRRFPRSRGQPVRSRLPGVTLRARAPKRRAVPSICIRVNPYLGVEMRSCKPQHSLGCETRKLGCCRSAVPYRKVQESSKNRKLKRVGLGGASAKRGGGDHAGGSRGRAGKREPEVLFPVPPRVVGVSSAESP